MKKLITLCTAILLFVIAANAQTTYPANTCGTAISLGSNDTCNSNVKLLMGNHLYFAFTPSVNDSLTFTVTNSDSAGMGFVGSVAIYASCSSLAMDSIGAVNDSTPIVLKAALMAGHTYYILLTRNFSGCTICPVQFAYCLNLKRIGIINQIICVKVPLGNGDTAHYCCYPPNSEDTCSVEICKGTHLTFYDPSASDTVSVPFYFYNSVFSPNIPCTDGTYPNNGTTGCTYNVAGIYYVQIGGGVAGTANFEIIVDSTKPMVSFTINPNPVCAGQIVCFTSTSNPNKATGLTWVIDGVPYASDTIVPGRFGYVMDTDNTLCTFFCKPGNHTIKLIDSNACGKDSLTQILTVDSLKAFFTANNACVGQPVTFNNLSTCVVTDSADVTYYWHFGNGNISTLKIPPVQIFGSPGTYNDTLIITEYPTSLSNLPPQYTDSCMERSIYVAPITIYPIPILAFLSNRTVCKGQCVLLSEPHVTGQTYSWSPATGLSCTICDSTLACDSVTTTYTVTATNAHGCKNSTSVTVFVDPPPSLCAGNTQTFCAECGKPITVSIGQNPFRCPILIGSHYSWSGSPAVACPACSYTSVTLPGPCLATTTYTYTLTLTDAHGCTASTTYKIILNPSPSVSIRGPDLACAKVAFHYCPTVTGGTGTYTYSWNVTGGSTTTAPCPHGIGVTWANSSVGGNVILTVTDSLGCIGIDTLVVRGCCSQSNGPGLENDTLSKLNIHSLPPGMQYLGGKFYIESTFPFPINGLIVVNVDLIIRRSQVACGTNAKIVVTGGHSITIDTSHIYACANMWDGIYLTPNLSLSDTANVKCSVIEDAENAIVSLGGAPYFINSSILNKNFIGIKVEPYAGTFTGTMVGSYITCDTLHYANQPPLHSGACIFPPSLYPHDTLVSLKAPHAGFRSYVGIDIGTVTNINIGNANHNTYQDLDYGIYSHTSNLTVNHDYFVNMDTIAPGPIKANTKYPAGILALGDPTGAFTLKVGVTSLCVFTVCKYGIWARDTINAIIEHNSITGSTLFGSALKSIGINITENYNRRLHVDSNNTFNYYIGVNAYRNVNSATTISKNGITGAGIWSTSYGILINEFPVTATTHYNVDSNNIHIISSGIYSVDLDKALIDHNVTIIPTGNGLLGYNNGIYASGSVSSRIINNTINYVAPKVAYGIRVDHGKSNVVSCNTINYIGTAIGSEIAFWGPQTPNTLVDLNALNMHIGVGDTGIHLLMTGTNIGHQGSVSVATANCWTPFSGFPPVATFADNNSNFSVGCVAPPTQFYVSPASPGVCEYPALNMNKRAGIGCVIPFNSGKPLDTNSCPSKTHAPLDNPLDSASAMGIVNDSAEFSVYNSTSIWLDKNTLFHYLTEIDTSLTIYPAIKSFRDSATISNMGIIKRIDHLLSDPMGVSIFDIGRANILNHLMISPNAVEKTYQKVYDVMIDMFFEGSNIPDSAEQNVLKRIAPLCPAEFGTGVYVARAMLSQVDTNHYYSTCTGRDDDHEAINLEKKNNNVVPPSVKVYPNPANTLLNIQVNLPAGEVARICLFNSIGQLVQCIELQNELTTLPTSSLAAGIYFYRILDENGNVLKADKQMIIH